MDVHIASDASDSPKREIAPNNQPPKTDSTQSRFNMTIFSRLSLFFPLKGQRILTTELADIEYHGTAGITNCCVRAIARLLSNGEAITKASLITHNNVHAFIVTNLIERSIAIKNGFSSGYPGEAPRGLATALMLFKQHHIDIEEYRVDAKFMHRLEVAALLQSDLDWLSTTDPVRPQAWHDYIYAIQRGASTNANGLSQHYPVAIPYALVDQRIMDLAIDFENDPDKALASAYRRLEQGVRERTQIAESGYKLFSRAFQGANSPLTWSVPDNNEANSRASLFTSVFGAFRNARMHREIPQSPQEALREFLLVNELFLLEQQAVARE